MDLRVKRTQKNIREAFFRLRKKKNLDKISVKELSEKAMINKATFYLHYKDVYDLSEKLENELIASMIDEVRSYDLRKGRSEFRGFAEKLSKTIIENSSEIKTLFSGYEDNHFINRFEDKLKDYIFRSFPNIPNNNEINIALSLFIQGAYHSHIRNHLIAPDVRVSVTTNLFMKMIDA